MTTLTIEIPDDTFEDVERYASRVGLPVAMLAREALLHTVRSDRYGLEELALAALQRETRAAELRARQARAGGLPVAKPGVRSAAPSIQADAAADDTVELPPEMLGTDLSLAYQEDNIPRDI